MDSSNLTTQSTTPNLQPVKSFFYRSRATIIAQVTSLVILGIVTMLGNLASIVTFAKTQSLRRRSNYMIINLSIADFSVSIVIFIVAYFFYLEAFTVPYHLKLALELLDSSTGAASLLGLTMISVERFYAVVFPFKHRMLRFKHHLIMCLVPWLAAAVVLLTNVVLGFPEQGKNLDIFELLRFSVMVLSLVVIFVSYLSIWLKSRHANPSAQNQNRTVRDKKLSLTLFIVTLASLSTWLPLQCFMAALVFIKSLSLSHYNNFFILKFVQYLNSAINFFIYILRMRDFRSGFRAIFCGKRERSKPSQSTTTSNLSLSFTKQKAYTVNNVIAAEGCLDASNLQLQKLTMK
ncbi:melatonin-related receptor-like [Exaiptasia diaphana]|uniref:G-protein coupled receptors family 1 profile domain-containing protein n=1 Tax=Exaiptasia diaphana TaxID=2652724 RepID=A0A913YRS4_EXADI|nr:melatonin-related receptor-like [Exaiptasia diaphana]